MRLVGYQPQYFPRLHYFARILNADIFAISDNVQFVRAHKYPTSDGGHKRDKSYQADTLIKTSQGIQVLTVPVKHHGFLPINQTEIAYARQWSAAHIRGVHLNYSNAENFSRIQPQIMVLLKQHYPSLADLTTATIFWALGWILGQNISPTNQVTLATINEWLADSHPFRLKKVVIKSQTAIRPSGAGRDATDWIIDSCRILGADEYYHGGTAGAAYLDAPRMAAAGIRLIEQDWQCQPYTQQFPKLGFIPNLSIIDLLANEEQQRVWKILKG